MNDYLPISKKDMRKRGWDEVDFVYVCGDAYVDHPSFGMAIITRVLEAHGFRIGVICQPDWKDEQSVQVFGRPRLGFLVSAGNMDSMVNHYTVSKKRRHQDAYTPGGVIGKRPDHATVVYCNLIRKVYKQVPIIIGGIEASLRRLAHYDYWSDSVKHSILVDSQADIAVYGMGERAIVAVAEALDSGIAVEDITFIDGCVYRAKNLDAVYDAQMLPSYDDICSDKKQYAKSFYIQYQNTDSVTAKRLVEPYSDHLYIVQNPPAAPLTELEMDDVYALPYMRGYHPIYEKDGGIPALNEIKFSLTSNRGCFGGCSFCALTFHQGRVVQVRSHESIIEEAKQMIEDPQFKGYIHDVGGPTANFRSLSCDKQIKHGLCKEKKCLAPTPCKLLKVDHSEYLHMLRKLRAVPKVKKVFIRSGIRYDYLMQDTDDSFFKELVQHHVSGQLKVAPEHCSANVLDHMGKPHIEAYKAFQKRFYQITKSVGKEQYLVPYLMSSHPGSTLKDAVALALFLKQENLRPEQVQDFYPTPGTISTCMFYTELNPYTLEKVYVPKTDKEKAMQRALLQYFNPKNKALVIEALKAAGRSDLIGNDAKCLVRPMHPQQSASKGGQAESWKKKKRSPLRNIHAKKSKKGR